MPRFSIDSITAMPNLTTVVAVNTAVRGLGALWIHSVRVRATSNRRVTKRYELMIVEGVSVRTCSAWDRKHNPRASAKTSEAATSVVESLTVKFTAYSTRTAA